MSLAAIHYFNASHDAKVTRVRVPSGADVAAWLFTAPLCAPGEMLGKHEPGQDFAAPIPLRFYDALIVAIEPAEAAADGFWFDEVHDEAWGARQESARLNREREAREAHAAAQADTLDAAIWWSGAPT